MSLDTKEAEAKMELGKDKRRASASAPMPATRRPKLNEKTEAAGKVEKIDDDWSDQKDKGEEEQRKRKDKDKEKKAAIERKRKDTDFRSGQRKMLVLLVKQVLKISQGQKDLWSAVMETVLIEAEGDILKNMKLQTTAYNLRLENKEATPAAMGPPHIYAMAGLMKAIVETKEAVGKKNMEEMNEVYTKYMGMKVEDRATMIRVCRTDKMWRADQRRLTLFLADQQISQLVVECLVQLGNTRKQGRAPATYLERELQEFVEALQL